MQAQFSALEGQVGALNEQMKRSVKIANGVNPAGYAAMSKAMERNSQVFRDAAASTGEFEVQQLRLNSATDDYVKKLAAQKLSFRQMRRESKIASAAYKEQLAMQNMIVRQMPGTAGGKSIIDVVYPKEVASELNTLGNRLGFLNAQLKSGATQMVNWGKNMQWAGRQLMVGFTVPVAAFAAATGVMAYKVQDQLVRIQKVYNTTADSTSTNVNDMIAVQKELQQVSQQAMNTAVNASRQYGSSMADTLAVQAELAATGKKGADLQAATTQVMRASTLGEMDYNDTLKSTIALQSVFGMSAKQLTDTFNYMNSVENATSLSMQDFATAIPIAAAPVKLMGGNIHDLGLLLTAMKSRGIEAAQGANAIKAAMQRLYRPSKQVQEEFTAITNASLADITKKNKGNLLGMLEDIAKVTNDLSRTNKIKAFSGLFGTYQVTRITAMLQGLQEINKAGTQVNSTFKIGQQDAKQWGKTADMELTRWQQSAAGKFKRAVETMKAEMAQMGEPFLEIGASIVSMISKIVSKFNDLPDSVKKAIGIAVGLTAIAGPIVMLVGLTGNLFGNFLKLITSTVSLGTRFKLLDKDSRAAALAAELASEGFITQQTATQKLIRELELLRLANEASIKATEANGAASNLIVKSYEEQAAAAHAAAVEVDQLIAARRQAGLPVTPAMTNLSARYGSDAIVYGDLAKQDKTAAAEAAPGTKKGSAGAKVFAASMAASAISMGAMAVSSNDVVDNLSSMVMTAAMLGPALAAVPWKGIGTGIASGAKALKGGFIPAILKGKAGIVGMVSAFWEFAGPQALIAGAIAGMVILHSKIDDNAEALAKLADTGDKWANIFGYQATKPGQMIDPKTGEVVTTLDQTVKDLQKNAPEVGNAIARAMDTASNGFSKAKAEAVAMNIAIRQGLEVMRTGGTADQARKAVQASLMAGIQNATEVTKLMKKVDLQVDFSVNKSVLRENLTQAMNQVQTAVNDQVAKTKVESVWDIAFGYNGPTDISKGSEQALVNAADGFYAQFAQVNAKKQIELGRTMQQQFEDMQTNAIQGALNNPKAMQILSKYGLNKKSTGTQFIGTMISQEDSKRLEAAGVDYISILHTIMGIRQRNIDFTKELGKQAGLTEKTMSDYRTIDDFLSSVVPNYVSIQDAQKGYNAQLIQANIFGDKFTGQQKLQLLNQYRVAAGLQKTGNILDGFGPVTKKWTDNTKQQGNAVDNVANKYNKVKAIINSITQEDINGLLKGAMGSFENGIADATATAFDNRMNAAIDRVQQTGQDRVDALQRRQQDAQDAMERRHQDAQDRLDARQQKREKAVSNSYDKRIKNIQNEIDAEKKADDVRQKLFDAEMARLDRLNEMANRNIDFNVALNSGQFDQAAKIRNDMQAQAQDWALQDSADSQKNKSDAHQEMLQKRIDKLNKAKDTALENLKKVEDAEKKSLQRRQDREKKALQRHQEDVLKSLQKQVDATNKAEKAKWDAEKKHLDAALKLFTGYTATSTKDLQKHIKTWESKYKNFNLITEGEFNDTTKSINTYLRKNLEDSRKEFANEKDWQISGNRIANAMLKGAFGMNTSQFKQWLITGQWPDKAQPPTLKDIKQSFNNSTPGGYNAKKKVDRMLSRHEGGPIGGKGKNSRKGYARNAPLSRNEHLLLAEKGEYVVNKNAASKHSDVLDAINSGNYLNEQQKPNTGGMGMGFAGIMGALMAKAVMQSLSTGIVSGATAALTGPAMGPGGTFSPGQAGTYANFDASLEQMRNAATIASVGKSMGMSARDIEIGIMTAITESMLRNVHYGDRDSQGLFQQRPSQGWGSVAQVTNPTYAATQFFKHLKGVDNRGNMSPWLAAQSVQRSAYSDGSNYQQYWNAAKAIFGSLGRAAGASGSLVQGVGGRHKPVNGGHISQGLHDTYTGYPAIDIGLPVGTPVYAVGDGRIGISKDLRGSDGRVSNGGYYSYGRYMTLNLAGGGSVLYAHLNNRYAHAGQAVRGGTMIGRSGNTGHSFGPHLHFGANGGLSPYDFYPQLKVGGFTISDGLAKLHAGEMVATKPMTEDIRQGVKNFANGAHNEYNVNVNVTEPGATADEIVNKTITALRRIENRKPQSRRNVKS